MLGPGLMSKMQDPCTMPIYNTHLQYPFETHFTPCDDSCENSSFQIVVYI